MQTNLVNDDNLEMTTLILVLDKSEVEGMREGKPFLVRFNPYLEKLGEDIRYPENFMIMVAHDEWDSSEANKHAADPYDYARWLGRRLNREDKTNWVEGLSW